MGVKLIPVIVLAVLLSAVPSYAGDNNSDFQKRWSTQANPIINQDNPGPAFPVIAEDSLWCVDVNGDSQINLLDVTRIIWCLYIIVDPPCDLTGFDFNGDAAVNILDIVFLVSYLYKGGPAPVCPPESLPSGTLVDHTTCILSEDRGAWIPNTVECVEYLYDGVGTLQLTHTNALFNCCFDSLTADIDISENIIDIVEHEHPFGGMCDCICLYDIDFEITNLPPAVYTIRVSNVYMENYANGEIIEFTVDLTQPLSGIYCVERPYLPLSQ